MWRYNFSTPYRIIKIRHSNFAAYRRFSESPRHSRLPIRWNANRSRFLEVAPYRFSPTNGFLICNTGRVTFLLSKFGDLDLYLASYYDFAVDRRMSNAILREISGLSLFSVTHRCYLCVLAWFWNVFKGFIDRC